MTTGQNHEAGRPRLCMRNSDRKRKRGPSDDGPPAEEPKWEWGSDRLGGRSSWFVLVKIPNAGIKVH